MGLATASGASGGIWRLPPALSDGVPPATTNKGRNAQRSTIVRPGFFPPIAADSIFLSASGTAALFDDRRHRHGLSSLSVVGNASRLRGYRIQLLPPSKPPSKSRLSWKLLACNANRRWLSLGMTAHTTGRHQ